MYILIVLILTIIPILGIANVANSNYTLVPAAFLDNAESVILSVANSSDQKTNLSSPPNITQKNLSNITILDSNLTNQSGNMNKTIPEQISPKSLNGSTPGKI
jgi:hypothetical protein